MRQNETKSRMSRMVTRRNRGFAIVAVTILLATAMVLIAATTVETSRKLGMVRQTENKIYATLLARSGLERAIVEIRADTAGYNGTPIQEVQSRRVYLVDPPVRQNNRFELVSTGVAGGMAQQMRMSVVIESGFSGVFDKAIYAGNIPPDPADQDNPPPENLNYKLEFGGEDGDQDRVFGDVYSGNDVDVDDDAIIRPPVEEEYTDVNGNGVYDRGDYLSLDINMNGEFDPDVSESYEDANFNGRYDDGEVYDDQNGNGQYDPREEFFDYDKDGFMDEAEPFLDTNGNDRYDYGLEAVGDVDYPNAPEAEGGDEQMLPPNVWDSDWPNTADIMVADRFAGIDSGILPEDNAAHVFIKNPTGREHLVDKEFELNGVMINPDDYFFEDPYEAVNRSASATRDNATRISLSGGPAGKEEDGNHVVYFVDGNLYIDNPESFTLKIQDAENNGIGVTIVVRGNIIIADNFLYRNFNDDQLAFIAIVREDDPKGEISGNIYIGDETEEEGTIAHIESLLYAQNCFYDNNLDEEGAKRFDIYGTMTAGNQIRINRDYKIPGHFEWRRIKGEWEEVWVEEEERHSAMDVIFDDRYVDGPNGRERMTPGLPQGPRRDSPSTPRFGATQYVGTVDVPQEYYILYGEHSTIGDRDGTPYNY